MSKSFAWSDSHLAIMEGQTAQFITAGPLHAAAVIAKRGEDILCMWMVRPDLRGRFTVRYQPGFRKVTSFTVLFEEPGAGAMTRHGDPVAADIAAEDELLVYAEAEVNRAMRMGLGPGGVGSGVALAPRVKPTWTGGDDFHIGPLRWGSCGVCGIVGAGPTAKFTWDYDVVPRYIIGYVDGAIRSVWAMDHVPRYKGHLTRRGGWEEVDYLEVLYHTYGIGEYDRVRRHAYWYGRPVKVARGEVGWLNRAVKED